VAKPAARPHRRIGFHVGVAFVCAALTAAVAWVAYTAAMRRRSAGMPTTIHVPTPPPMTTPPTPPTTGTPTTELGGRTAKSSASGPCAADMSQVQGNPGFCIDTYEQPGEGIIPVSNVTLEQARLACAHRSRRLCSADEWEAACRGPERLFYPYGKRFDPKRCNVREAGARQVQAAGSWPECRSPVGAADLSGNVAEWVEEGVTKGGSSLDGEDGRCSRSTRRRAGALAADVGYRCCDALAEAR